MPEETKIIRLIIDSSKAVDGSAAATRALEKLERSTAAMDTALARMEKGLGGIGTLIKANLALALADFSARMILMAKGAFDAAAGMDELAEQLGVTAKGLQGLQFSAVQSGVKLEQLETGVAKFSQKMGEAADGSREMIEALDRIGVKNLDVQGKLRPTEELMQDVAAAILALEDPAKRSAAAVEFFGKAGARMLPMLKDIADGADVMGVKAAAAGAMIEEHTIKRLDELADASERTKLRMRAFFANTAVDLLDWAAKNEITLNMVTFGLYGLIKNLDKIGPAFDALTTRMGDWVASARGMMDDVAGVGVRGAAMFVEAFRSLPELLGRLFTDGMNAAIAATERGVNYLNAKLAEKAPWLARQLGSTGGMVEFGRLEGGGASVADYGQRIRGAGDAAADQFSAGRPDYQAELNQRRRMAFDQWFAVQESKGVGQDTPNTTGAGMSGIKGAGQDVEDRIGKLRRETAREVEAAQSRADASVQGGRAVADLEAHFKALKEAQDAYGKTADANKEGVARLTAEIEKQVAATERLKNLSAFNLDTEALEKQNVILEAENRLINATVEDRTREIALIKLKQEIEAKGLDANDPKERDAIARRADAITQNERLKAQGEELRKANELWTEPLKSALSSIQSTAADMFDSMLEKGTFSFEEIGKVGQRIVRRMVAEFAALAVIRPMLGGVVGGLSAIGLVSPATASSLGYGSTGGSGGGFSMPGFGGFGSGMGSFELPSWLGGGSIGNLMAATPFASAAPAGGFASIEALMASGQAGSSAGWAAGGLGGAVQGLSVGSMLGAGVGIGMGAYSLATSKNTAQTIGGIGQMIGGGMMLIPGMQIPGMVVSALSAILPSLFGGEEYKWAPLAGANVQFNPGAGGYSSTATQQLGGASIAGQYAGVGQTLDAFFKAAGGITDASKAFGAAIWQNQREGTTSTYEISPSQGSHQLSEGSGDQSAAVDRMIAKVFYNSIQNNAAMNAQPTLRTAFSNREPTTTAQISSLFDLIKAYDQLGKETSSAEKALKAISDSFASLTSGANEWGLALAPIEAEQKKQTIRTAQDFIDSMLDPLAVQRRALDDQARDSIASAEYIRDNVKDVYVDMAKVAEYWTKKKADFEAQYYQGSVDNLQALIKRLTYGDLANASPDLSLSGTRASYAATLAQAQSGDATALTNLAGSAETYATSARSYFASSPEYNAIVEQLRRDLEDRVGAITGGTSSSGTAANSNEATNAVLQSNAELRSMVATLVSELSSLKDQLAAATAQLQRRA